MLSVEVSPSTSIETTTETEKRRKNKYILYGTTSGWSNQVESLEHAYWLAAATDRTLILAPIMGHFETIQWTYAGEKTVEEVYQSKLDSDHPTMTSVLNFTTAHVPVIDYKDYFQQYHHNSNITIDDNPPKTEIQLTFTGGRNNYTQYRCDNTIFTNNKLLHGQVTTNKCAGHVGMVRHDPKPPYENVTYKHPHLELVQTYDRYDVWTFTFLFPESLFHRESFESDHDTRLPFRYVESIQQAARDIITTTWKIPSRQYYFSLHYRGGDGPFKRNSNWTEIILTSLNEAKEAILLHAAQNKIRHDHQSTTTDGPGPYVILLVTDIEELIDIDNNARGKLATLWKNNCQRIVDEISQEDASIKIRYVTSESYKTETNALIQLLQQNEYAPIFLDQQLAACAGLGYSASHLTRNPRSTFQNRIQKMRQQAEMIC
jgi:hypothetical protein